MPCRICTSNDHDRLIEQLAEEIWNRFAIDVLDAARASAEPAPIKPGPAARPARAWLSINGIAEGWQVEQFWTGLSKPPDDHGMGPY